MQRKAAPQWVILGGSFSPVHVGHVELVRVLAGLPGVEQVLVVPALLSPYKQGQAPLPAALRWRMLCAALAKLPRTAVLDLELRRPPPSYAVETVAALADAYPRAALRLAMGEDVLAGFAGWRGASALLEQAGLIVLPRAGTASPDAAPGGAGSTAQLLPPPWPERISPDGPGRWVDSAGRLVVERLAARLPEVSASRILATRSLEHVPPGARELLAEFWRGSQG